MKWVETKNKTLENTVFSRVFNGQPVQKRTESSNYQKRAPVARLFSEKRLLCQKPNHRADFPMPITGFMVVRLQ